MSIKKRIQILLAFLVGVPLILMLYESYQTSRNTLIAEMKKETLQVAKLETAEIDLIFAPPRLVAESLVRALETDPVLKADTIRELLRRTLRESPDIYGLAVALDPAETPLKRFAPYVFRKKGVETEIVLPYEYTRYDWYQKPLERSRGQWISPYFGEGGEVLMVSYVAPLRQKDRIVGMVAVDLSLDELLKRLYFLKPGGSGTVYLINPSGKILAHPALKAVADVANSQELGELTALMRRAGVDTVEMKDPVTKKTSWIVESPIPSLSAKNGGGDWSLIVSWPIEERLGSLNTIARRMLVLYLFLGGGAIWFLNRTFNDAITRPLRQLAEQARQYASGDFRNPAPVVHETEELRELGMALTSLGEALKGKETPDRTAERDDQQ